jgi:hypothetical protein
MIIFIGDEKSLKQYKATVKDLKFHDSSYSVYRDILHRFGLKSFIA